MLRRTLFALYFIVAIAAFGWPGFDIVGTRLEPMVLGVPPAFAWTVGWVLLTFFVLVIFHKTGGGQA